MKRERQIKRKTERGRYNLVYVAVRTSFPPSCIFGEERERDKRRVMERETKTRRVIYLISFPLCCSENQFSTILHSLAKEREVQTGRQMDSLAIAQRERCNIVPFMLQ